MGPHRADHESREHEEDESNEGCPADALAETCPRAQSLAALPTDRSSHVGLSCQLCPDQVPLPPVSPHSLARQPMGADLGVRGGERWSAKVDRRLCGAGDQRAGQDQGLPVEDLHELLVLHELHDHFCRLRRHRATEHGGNRGVHSHGGHLRHVVGSRARRGLRHHLEHEPGRADVPRLHGRAELHDAGPRGAEEDASAAEELLSLEEVRTAPGTAPQDHRCNEPGTSGLRGHGAQPHLDIEGALLEQSPATRRAVRPPLLFLRLHR
mmetsp:Transcript_60180/g.170680  ORF Transcript_60180/g.170680 Transcript_60180/m.170680 type:complete len:267 (-) Transcript_60180:230-1030(-)